MIIENSNNVAELVENLERIIEKTNNEEKFDPSKYIKI